MRDIVLDASAILALINAEPGAAIVAATLPGALLGMVNLAEIVTKLCERGMSADLARQAIAGLGVRVTDFTEDQAHLVGALRPLTRSIGLSLGDRACLALGKTLGATVLTSETAWPQVADAIGVEIKLIR